ncbi:DUF397 domain-containing protein [Streptosporangium carneum]|uniref:DUF397 domain-containing protein n=1 Tax=Streptosporangium carneum TaxID=47481 RepID=A0A9W6HZ00_9ACTN|nr:DUF397 domain-containing protein [Streptosporangium carneum]GLK08896.1 hypothetical protein GCM10017600_23010 [Streptosporangium carneum]
MDLNTLKWRKSSLSGNNGGDCVEVAELEHPAQRPDHKQDAVLALRDSKDPSGPVLFFNDAEWAAFLNGVKAREFDR